MALLLHQIPVPNKEVVTKVPFPVFSLAYRAVITEDKIMELVTVSPKAEEGLIGKASSATQSRNTPVRAQKAAVSKPGRAASGPSLP